MKILTKEEIKNLTFTWESFRDLVLRGEMDPSGTTGLGGVLNPEIMNEKNPLESVDAFFYVENMRIPKNTPMAKSVWPFPSMRYHRNPITAGSDWVLFKDEFEAALSYGYNRLKLVRGK